MVTDETIEKTHYTKLPYQNIFYFRPVRNNQQYIYANYKYIQIH